MMRAFLFMLFVAVVSCINDVRAEVKTITTGFHHIGLSVTKLQKSTEFFTDILGWELLGEDKSYPATFVSDGNMTIALWRVTDPKRAVEFNRKNNVGLHHLAISVNSFEALDVLYKSMKESNTVEIEFAPELAYGGPTRHMMVREPSGNRLEFRHSP
jgi:lactoylglutathione lyase